MSEETSPANVAIRETDARVVVGILTFRRPDDLIAVIAATMAQITLVPRVRLLIVDNDPGGSAREYVESVSATYDGLVHYVHEPRPGIAAARNRALDECAETAEALIFIDDDESPTEGWLQRMIGTWEQHRPCGVVGPIESVYEHEPDPFLIAGGFFNRRRLRTGERVHTAPTNNLLLDLSSVAAAGVRFNDAYGLTGGSDVLFTRQLTSRGGCLVWNADAMMLDRVPASRLTRKWVMQKALRIGNTTVRVDLEDARGWSRGWIRLRYLLAGLVRVLLGGARCAFGFLTRNLEHYASGARIGSRGIGMVMGAVGSHYSEYKRS